MGCSLALLIDPALSGPVNMAVDDCLLAGAAAAPTLRLYRWAEPTLSLGYFQSYEDAARLSGPLADLPVVRRVTGGGAILHADELTYSIALPPEHPLAGSAPAELYSWMHRRIMEAVASLGGRTRFKGCDGNASPRGGPFLCFRRHAGFDLVDGEVGDRKFAGSAQRRTRAGVLQHGSVILHRSRPVQPSAALDEMAGRAVSFDEAAAALVVAIEEAGVSLSAPRASAIETPDVRAAVAHHRSDAWLKRR